MPELPDGTVTFLFSDVEASTQLLERHGAAMGQTLARHHALFEQVVERHGGAIFETVGDAVYAAFPTAAAAVAAALDAQRALASEDWGPIGRLAVRIALHTGAVERRGAHYFGPALFRAARLQALGCGEQTLLSSVTARLVLDDLPAGASLRDLGPHRLKDLGEREQVYQLVHPDLRADFPALRSLDAHPHNLPLQLSSFVGRQAELAELGELLSRHRLLTLLGPGGTGKTRLALQVAAERLESFADGAWFVDLSAVRNPELLPGAVASALGLREQPGTPITTTMTDHLRGKQLLLVLDNLEQLLPAAATSLGELLAAAPGLRLLATSRAPLRLRGEREYPVPPLPVGDPHRLEPEPPAAVALFVERARDIRPDLEITDETGPLIAAVCARLDGLPLAIELAAARLRAFSLQRLNDRLTRRLPLLSGGARDLPERQQTLRAAIAWSVELLSEPERRFFARLGVFVSGCTLDATEAVAGPDLGIDAVDGLTSLLEQSLVREVEPFGDEPRYTMLETIRESALERLEASGEAEVVRERHAEWLAALVEAEMERYAGPEHGKVLDRIAGDIGDFRVALDWALETRHHALATRLVLALARYWDERDTTEGIRWLERIASGPIADGTRIALVRRLGWLHSRRGDRLAAERDFTELLELGRAAGDTDAMAAALSNLAFESLTRGDLDAASHYLDELDSVGDDEDPWGRAITARLRGRLQAESGRMELAEQHFTRSQTDARRTGDPALLASVLHDHGMAALWSGDYAVAERDLNESAELALSTDFKGVLGPALTHLAALAARRNRAREARTHLLEALDVLAALGGDEWLEDLLDVAAWVAYKSGLPDAAAQLVRWADSRWQAIAPGARSADRAWHETICDSLDIRSGDTSATPAGVSAAEAVRYARAVAMRAAERERTAPPLG